MHQEMREISLKEGAFTNYYIETSLEEIRQRVRRSGSIIDRYIIDPIPTYARQEMEEKAILLF